VNSEYRQLRVDKLIETADRLASRITGRFPAASLGKLAFAVADVTREAVARADKIQRPDWLVRGGLLALAAALLGLAVAGVVLGPPEPGILVVRLLEILRMLQGALVFLSAVVVFLWTLETRLKRGRAVRAIHELRALAHIIDMHQLSKDPEAEPGDDPTYNNRDARRAYLQYCSELLALVSKIGQLYVQDFPDGTTLATVNQFENLANGLSQKIWQKLIILDNEDVPASTAPGQPS
jgi:hypothetical protein